MKPKDIFDLMILFLCAVFAGFAFVQLIVTSQLSRAIADTRNLAYEIDAKLKAHKDDTRFEIDSLREEVRMVRLANTTLSVKIQEAIAAHNRVAKAVRESEGNHE